MGGGRCEMREVAGEQTLAWLPVPLKRLMSVKKASSDKFQTQTRSGHTPGLEPLFKLCQT